MADPTALSVLQSIDASLKTLVQVMSVRPAVGHDPFKPANLDGPHGNPVVKKKDPRDWTGTTMVGRKFSDCPPEYLDMVADRELFFAEKADEAGEKDDKGRPKSYWNHQDAAKARGWAARIRSGAHVQPVAQDEPDERW
jgi:hypothetical protein